MYHFFYFAGDVIAIRPDPMAAQPISNAGVRVTDGLNALPEHLRQFASLSFDCGTQQKQNLGYIQNITQCEPYYKLFAIRAVLVRK